MPEHASILQLLGVTVFALAAALWMVGLVRIARRQRLQFALRRKRGTLHGLPRQRPSAPHLESVELTPAERDAFAGLVRQFSD